MSQTIDFKSYQENYRKEYIGIKNNTLRKVDDKDIRKEILDKYIHGEVNNLFIRIINTDTQEEFMRKVRDVTLWDGWYLITWDTEGLIRI